MTSLLPESGTPTTIGDVIVKKKLWCEPSITLQLLGKHITSSILFYGSFTSGSNVTKEEEKGKEVSGLHKF
ncbi:hypothetical protein E2C01_001006 [Portunus trituberculatus]|uniref:Uncharacterized protein n=1 Tax=Portunus trituberculatus TaxID=210409 RepID=A0A5B7CFT8_PORTR|nr:hypothetical protein [Portunus trituberculatus]